MMDRCETKPMVLARIPNVRASRAGGPPEAMPASRGRIISQALSFKVLAGVTLLLVAVAIIGRTIQRQNPSSPEATTTADTWRPSVRPAPVGTTSVPSLVSEPIPSSGNPMSVSAVCETTDAGHNSGQESSESRANVPGVTPVSASIDEPLMSTWPNPSQPLPASAAAGEAKPRVDVNRSMAIRPSDRAY